MFNLFQDYIPQAELLSDSEQNQLVKDLEIYGELDPELVYYFIQKPKYKENREVRNGQPAANDFLAVKVSKARRLKNRWAHNALGTIIARYPYSVSIKRINSYYKSNLYKAPPVFYEGEKWQEDQNLKYYFMCLFISRTADTFDPDRDYREKYKDILERLVKFYTDIYTSNIESDRDELENYAAQALKHAYLFKGSYLKSIPVTTDFYLFEFIEKLQKPKYVPRTYASIQLPLEVVPVSHNEKFGFTDPMHYHNNYYYQFNVDRSLYANAALQLKLKETLNPGAFVRFSFGYTIHQQSNYSFKDTTLFSGRRSIPGLDFEGEYIIYGVKNFSSFGFTAQVSAPIHYFNRKLYLEAGLAWSYQNLKFEFDITKPGIFHKAWEDPGPFFDDDHVRINKHYNILHPLAALNYELSERFNFRLDYLFPAYITLGISVNYNL